MTDIKDFEPDSPISKIMHHLHLDVRYIPYKSMFQLRCKCCNKVEEFTEKSVCELNEKDQQILHVLDKLIQANS